MQLYNAEGVVLRLYELNDADRIAVVLSKEYGKMRIVVKGARKMKSRFAGAVQPPSYGIFQLAAGKSMDILQQIDVHEQFLTIKQDLDRIGVACILMELAEKAFIDSQPVEGFFDFFLASLRFLSVTSEPSRVCLAYEARILSFLGYAIIHDSCSVCGDEEFIGQYTSFSYSPSSGGLVCPLCDKKTSGNNKVYDNISKSQLNLLSLFLNAEASDLEKIQISSFDYKCLSRLVRQSISWHLDQKIKAWRFNFLLETL